MNQSLQHNEVLLNTPPQNIQDCCCVSALRCFHKNLKYLNVAERQVHVKLQKSLKHSLTERGLDFCNQGKAESTTCQNCTTYPKANSKEFVIRLESLIQRALTKRKMKI
ncbi:interleukin-21 isoform X2 [Thalassophryne amazonica]|nr:interleukin-21 isoform X2 [Thalassophryne amazonica]XP_034037329.1 interleukin-21 isoform X2 [Thalassophryne amazonica]